MSADNYIEQLREQKANQPSEYDMDIFRYVSKLVPAVKTAINKHFNAGVASGYVCYDMVYDDPAFMLSKNVDEYFSGNGYTGAPNGHEATVHFPDDLNMIKEIVKKLEDEIRKLGVKTCTIKYEKHPYVEWEYVSTFLGSKWKYVTHPNIFFYSIYIKVNW